MDDSMVKVEEVYRAHHRRLWRALLSYSGDPDVASDAEAEAFTQALNRGDGINDVVGWVWKAAFRIAAGMLQDRRRTWSSETGVDPDVPAPVVEFLQLLGNLSNQQRACVVLRYVGGFKPVEIAQLLETSPATVRVQLHRAHGRLRADLDRKAST